MLEWTLRKSFRGRLAILRLASRKERGSDAGKELPAEIRPNPASAAEEWFPKKIPERTLGRGPGQQEGRTHEKEESRNSPRCRGERGPGGKLKTRPPKRNFGWRPNKKYCGDS